MENSFLGKGWSFPPRFEARGARLKVEEGSQNVHKSILLILTTELGERPLNPNFGSSLSQYLYEPISDRLVNELSDSVEKAILRHETRIELNQVEITTDDLDAGLLRINVQYTLKATNSRYNLVYPFYLNESSQRGVLNI